MYSTYFHESYYPGHEDHNFTETYAELPTFHQYPHDYTYQGTIPGLNVALPLQSLALPGFSDTWGRTPALLPTTPTAASLPSRATEGDCSHVAAPPLGFSVVRDQVRPSAAYTVKVLA